MENNPHPQPGYIRLPKSGGRCPYTGLSRTTLLELSVPCRRNGFKPAVESIHLKRRSAQRGIRLINRASLFDYLASLNP